jgi:hypothetical protein
MTCPSDVELARALTVGADPEISAHLAACATCRDYWDATHGAIELARELPVAIPPHARREEMRTAMLAASASVAGRAMHRAWIAPAVALAAAAGLVGALAVPGGSSSPSSAGLRHGIVRRHPAPAGATEARYSTTSVGADEVVRLTDGTIDIEVEPLSPGERFRVIVGDAEIEVRGTVFTVSASAEHLLDVAVARGRVDVKPETGPPATLGAGQSWHVARAASAVEPTPPAMVPPPPLPSPPPRAPAPPSALRPAPVAAPHRQRLVAQPLPRAKPPAPSASAEPPPAPVSSEAGPAGAAEELSYDQAWEAMRANDFARAASGFSRVLLIDPDGRLVEDASFWHAVALARGKRSAEALSAFRDFLDSYAGSVRAGEASAMLGWILVDARDYDEAARRFRAAADDPRATVRDSARAGLAALAKRKG